MAFIPEVFSACAHPIRLVINDVVRYMPCNKCEPCLTLKASGLRARVKNEADYHRFTFFCTMTYDNAHLPLCSYSDYFGRWMRSDIEPLGKSTSISPYVDNGYSPSYAQNQLLPEKYSKYCWRPWVTNFHHRNSCGVDDSRNYFGVVSVADCQKFLKRLRKNLSSEYNREQRRIWKFRYLRLKMDYGYVDGMSDYTFKQLIKNNFVYEKEKEKILAGFREVRKYRPNLLRYFLCAEYGPETFRPHYHALLFTNDETVARLLPAAFAKSWSCSLDTTRPIEQVESSSRAVGYVSKYVTGNTDLPEILREKCTRTFYLASRRPCFGTVAFDYEKVRSYFDKGTIFDSMPVYDKDGTFVEFTDVRVPKSVVSRYFPKCQGYESLSYTDKLRVYSRFFTCTGRDKQVTKENYKPYELYPRYERNQDNLGVLLDLNYVAPAQDILAARACARWCDHFKCLPSDYVEVLDWFYYKIQMSLLAGQYTLAERYNNVCYDESLLLELPKSVGYMMPGEHVQRLHYSFEYVQMALDWFRWNSDLSRGIENILGLDVGFFYHDDGNLDEDAVNRFLERNQEYHKRYCNGLHDKTLLANKTRMLNDKKFLHKKVH